MAGTDESQRMKCGFSDICPHIQCGLVRKYKLDVSVILLKRCEKDITDHLLRFMMTGRGRVRDIQNEWQLIALRAGIFDLASDDLDTRTICPSHRYKLGLNWNPSRKCQHPLHEAKAKAKPRTDRAVRLQISMEVFQIWNTLLPIGSNICGNCETKHKEAVTARSSLTSTCSVTETGVEPQPGPSDMIHLSSRAASSSAKGLEEPGPSTCSSPVELESSAMQIRGDTSSETSSVEFQFLPPMRIGVKETEDTDSSPRPDCIIKGQELESSNEEGSISSQDELAVKNVDMSWAPTPAPKFLRKTSLSLLNRFLEEGGCEPLRGQLQLPLQEASASTVRYYKGKAREAIGLVLHCVAPGQEDELMSLLQKQMSVDDSLTSTLVKCYDEATTWFTRRQILSILAENRTKEQLLGMIPGLTVYRIDQARKHAKEVGQAQPVELEPITKSRLDDIKVDHFLDFISRPEFVQDVAYGTKTMKLSHGEKLDIPNVVRTVIASRIVQLYQGFCEETGFEPLKRSSLFSIIQVCAASQKKSLAGLDNIAAEGSEAFESLFSLVETLGQCGYATGCVEDLRSGIRSSKLYLKCDFKLHVNISSRCPDHCIFYALAGGTSKCSHPHDICCQSCDDIREMFDKIEAAIDDPAVKYRYDKQREEVVYEFEAAKERIVSLKAHILRANNQEQAKTDILDNMTECQALITMDWAMKFLPSKFREAQQDWFGKKGISWHISAVVSKDRNQEYQIHCYTHVVDQCKQDWFAVLSVVEATLKRAREDLPSVKEVFFRSDNAGCYHNASLLLTLPSVAKHCGFIVRRYDFSEAQAGKDICDRKIAPMKSHIQRFINEGHNVSNAAEMLSALGSYGGVRGCYPAELTLDVVPETALKLQGITSYTNFEYVSEASEGIRVWQAYGIGEGTFLSNKTLFKKCPPPCQDGTNVQIGEYRRPTLKTGAVRTKGEPEPSIPCVEDCCILVFKTQEDLTVHIASGKHTEKPVRETKMDNIKRKWAAKFSAVSKSGQSAASGASVHAGDSSGSFLPIESGWALRVQKTNKRFSGAVSSFLHGEFMKGVQTGMKENPADVSRKMRTVFGREDWLTTQQIMAFFSRLSAKHKCGRLADESIEEEQEVAVRDIINRRSLRKKVAKEAGL